MVSIGVGDGVIPWTEDNVPLSSEELLVALAESSDHVRSMMKSYRESPKHSEMVHILPFHM